MADRLNTYRAKRDFGATPEPAGEAGEGEGRARFVIQEHHATRLHWDLRLERDGVLASWAIPNGLPEEPKDNRLAVHTEDHPLEYLDFHGEIPKGSYGAGTMTIWDRGTYEELKWEPRKVEVALHGERVRGRYALFPIDKDEQPKDWMIHRMDPPADARREPMPDKLVPMLARAGTLPRDDERWAYEIKWDGVRAVAHSEPGRLRLQSRNLNDITARYPELARLNRALSHHRAILDGEVVAFDADGPAELRSAAAAHAPRLGVGGPPPGARGARDLRDLRPAVARRPFADGPALRRAPRAAGRARPERRALAHARARGRPWRRHARGQRRAGPGGRHGQAPGLDLRAGAAQRRAGSRSRTSSARRS